MLQEHEYIIIFNRKHIDDKQIVIATTSTYVNRVLCTFKTEISRLTCKIQLVYTNNYFKLSCDGFAVTIPIDNILYIITQPFSVHLE